MYAKEVLSDVEAGAVAEVRTMIQRTENCKAYRFWYRTPFFYAVGRREMESWDEKVG
jgi:hypothetical protein